jgi:hypothetical protein
MLPQRLPRLSVKRACRSRGAGGLRLFKFLDPATQKTCMHYYLWILLAVAGNVPAAASPAAPVTTRIGAVDAGMFLGGALTAFVAHESGHVLMNYALGNSPRWVGVTGFGFVPFFAISPNLSCNVHGCRKADGRRFDSGLRGLYLISTAGFLVQHVGSEAILDVDPGLRDRHAPFRKGILAFNVWLSVGYAMASMLAIEDSHGDAGGAARAAGVSPYIFSPLLLLPAALDAYRYYYPEAAWAAWLSRGSKVGMVGLAYTF